MAEVKKVRLKSELPLNLEIEDLIWRKGFTNIAGIDEAGCGPLAGPVVAAAIVFQPYFHIPAVKDSKKLSPKKRENIFSVIIDHSISYGVGIVSNVEIDKTNIRKATFKAMRKAIGKLKTSPLIPLLAKEGETGGGC